MNASKREVTKAELVVVLAIVAIFAAILMPALVQAQDNGVVNMNPSDPEVAGQAARQDQSCGVSAPEHAFRSVHSSPKHTTAE